MKVPINIDLTQSAIAFDFEGKKVAFNFDMFMYIFGHDWKIYTIQGWKDILENHGAYLVDTVALMCGIEAGIFEITYNII